MSKKVKRLLEQFVPESYQLHVSPDRNSMTFTGTVTIKGKKIGRPSQRLTFHQKDLKILDAKIVKHEKKGDQILKILRINRHDSFDEVRLHAENLIYPGSYMATISFSGKITKPMQGIYPCYFNDTGKEKVLIATQLESHHAREVFPCIDEPEAKAIFELAVTAPTGETVLSNAKIRSVVQEGKQTTTLFEKTPRMSSYLLAFVFGELNYLKSKTKSDVEVRVYATKDNVKHTQFALDCAVKILDFYNEYFGIEYPLEKCDMVALPDFASGAMENWGLITYREQALLVDPKNTSLPTKQFVAMVVAHELAHQWFGNLVTMRWWTDLWLNEGFASWIEYMAVDKIFPSWQMWTQFIVDEQEAGLRQDALEHTHAIEVPINHPDEIRTIFDNISYQKGSSVIHMLYKYLGAVDFRTGLQHYLKLHAYGNTDTVDLWSALEQTSGKPVRNFMQAWTSQPGFPLLKAEIASNKIHLSQQRFYINPKAKKDDFLWSIPLAPNYNLDKKVLIDKAAVLDISLKNGPLILNQSHSGYYRTVYDSGYLLKLGELIKAGDLPVLDRMGVLSDAVEATKAGHLGLTDVTKILSFYKDEDTPVVWDILAGLVGSVRAVMNDEGLRESMKPFMRSLVTKQLKRLGWIPKKNETYFDSLLRPTILGLAAAADEPEVVKESIGRFENAKKPEDIDPDIRPVIFGTAARKGGKPEFKKLLEMHNNSANSEVKATLSAALTGFKHPVIIKQALSMINSSNVRLQDVGYWVAYSFSNRYAKRLTWTWMTDNWQWLEKNLGSDLSFYRFPIYSARSFSDEGFLKEYKKFFDLHMNPAMERPVAQGLEIIAWQSAWRKRDLLHAKNFFKELSKSQSNKKS